MTTSPPDISEGMSFAWRSDEQSDVDLRMDDWPVRDQEVPDVPTDACAAFAATALHELAIRSVGFVSLSEMSLIRAMGTDPTGGIYLADAFDALHKRGQLSRTDYLALMDDAAANLLWRKVWISPTSRSPANIAKLVGKGRPVLLGLKQMVSLSRPDERGVVTLAVDDKAEGNPGNPVGHAVVVVGKAKIAKTGFFLVRNSWGDDWARGGYGFIGFDYVKRYGRDAAIVKSI